MGNPKILSQLSDSIRNTLARGVVSLVTDGLKMQGLQLTVLDGETIEGAERFQEYGFTSHPLPGAEALITFVGADRSHPVVVAVDDRRYRLQPGQPGEVTLYTDEGDSIKFLRGNIIEINTKELTINAENAVTVHTKSYTVNATAGTAYTTPAYSLQSKNGGAKASITGAVAVNGSVSSTGDQIAGGISQTGHVHSGVQTGGSTTGGPQ